MMSRLTKDPSLPGPSASTSHEGLECDASSASNRTLKVTLLSSEWQSTKGGLSTINRELAIQLAKHPNVEVCMYLPRCSEEDKRTAACHKVHLIEAEEMPGYDPVDWLATIPKDHVMDCVIGHGVHLGRQVPHIKRVHGNCKWVQVVHTDPEELGMFKNYANPVSKGEKKHQAEVKLCKLADQVVAVGSKLAEAFATYLRPSGKDQDVFNLTPSIFTEFMDVTQAAEERKTFRVLVFGRGDSEDFRLKGYDIAAKAIAELKEMPQDYKLVFVGAAFGEEEKVTELLLKEGIARRQLIIRHFDESREHLAELFCEVDLAIMPSRTEGFGLAALEALSAGLPVLVSGNSGLGDALKRVLHGSNCVVNSDDPKRWADAIQAVCDKDRGVRLGETKDLCGKYAEKYSWEEQCGRLVQKMMDITFTTSPSSVKGYYVQVESIAAPDKGLSGLQSSAGKENKEPTPTDEDGPSTEQSPMGGRVQETSGSTFDLKDLLINLLISAPDLDDKRRAALYDLLASIGKTYVQFHNLTPELRRVEAFYEHLKYMYNSTLVTVNKGSLKIVVRCPTLESLERLWRDCRSGHLNKLAERLLVTDEIKRKLNVETVRLTTTIEKKNYLKCKKALMEMSGAAGSTHFPSEETKPDEREDPRGTGTSSDSTEEVLQSKIRVYCRVRPLSNSEKERGNFSCIKCPDEYTVIVETYRGPRDFQYDQVFTPEHGQDKVFENTYNLIQSAVDGYNVCIFTYGQTGSGKTYTMIGDKELKSPGIAPRAMEAIYNLMNEQKSKFSFRVHCYMLELYNDRLIDLLAPAGKEPVGLDIKKDKKGVVFVQGSVMMEAASKVELWSIFEKGSEKRHVSSTKMNAESSRSHLILGIVIESTNLTSGAIVKGKVSLMDFAGSDRGAKTGATPEQLKDTQYINASVSALGRVIAALSGKRQLIPYRDSKLTMLMQDSLGGNAKTLMIVNISPADYNSDETVTSLSYASRVKLITNHAQKNSENKEIKGLKKGETVDDAEVEETTQG